MLQKLAYIFLIITSLLAIDNAQLERSINTLIAELKASQNPNGHLGKGPLFLTYAYKEGYTAISALALVYAGVPSSDPVVKKALQVLLDSPPKNDVYSVSSYMMLLEEVDPIRYKNELQRTANWLVQVQADNGTWNYRGTGQGDNSVTQFAILGLKAARDAGVNVPHKVFRNTKSHFKMTQNKQGGWGYMGGNGTKASMTAAGLSTLSICGEELEESLELSKGRRFIGRYSANPSLDKAMNLLERIIRTQPRSVFGEGYTAYGFERVGIFFDKRYLGGVDWYREGAQSMISNDFRAAKSYGSFFPLLFLAKGNIPVLIGKFQPQSLGEDWNLRRNDCRNLAKDLSKVLETRVDWEAVRLSKDNPTLGKLPILYWSGWRGQGISTSEVAMLKSYLDDGGNLLIAPNQKSDVFEQEVFDLLQKVYPGSVFEDLPYNHDLRHMFYDLREEELPIRILSSHCTQFPVFLLDQDLSLQYEAKKPSKINRLMMANLARYALQFKPLLGRLVEKEQEAKHKNEERKIDRFLQSEKDNPEGLHFAYLSFSGAQMIAKKAMGLEAMQSYFREALQIPSRRKATKVELHDLEELLTHPFVLISGSTALNLSVQEKENLKLYLESGGFVYAENTCSKVAFGNSLKLLLEDLFPGESLEPLPAEHPIYKEPFGQKIEAVGKVDNDEFLQALTLDRRQVLIYSPYDLSASLAGDASHFGGLESESAVRLLVNIISYALSY